MYRYLFNIPENDPRLDGMSDYDFQLEVAAHIEMQKMMRGETSQAPSADFLDAVKRMSDGTLQLPGTPVSPTELGWDEDE